MNNEFLDKLTKHHSRTAVIDRYSEYTYEALIEQALRLCSKLEHEGLDKGDRFALVSENSTEFIVAYLAAMLSQYVIVPLNADMTHETIDAILKLSSPKYCLTNDDVKSSISEFTPSKIKPKMSGDLFGIFFSSGTTGVPKAVCHSLDSLTHNAKMFCEFEKFDQDCRMLHCLPMGYMAGFINTIIVPMHVGGTICLAPKFSALTATSIVSFGRDTAANTAWFTPTIIEFLTRLIRTNDGINYLTNRLKNVYVATAPLGPLVRERYEDKYQTTLAQSYGLSETLILTSQHGGSKSKNLSNTVGELLPGIQAKIQTDGELSVSGTSIFLGYLDEQGTVKDHQGPFSTGDLVQKHANLELEITGRKKDLIIKGGENLSSKKIEDYLLSIPGVSKAAVVGKPDDFWGEVPVGFLECDKKFTVSAQEIMTGSKKALGKSHALFDVVVLDNIPVTSIGKIQKDKLKKLL